MVLELLCNRNNSGWGGSRYSDIPLSLEIKHFTDPLIPCILRKNIKKLDKKKREK